MKFQFDANQQFQLDALAAPIGDLSIARDSYHRGWNSSHFDRG